MCAVLIENPNKSYLSLETKDIKLLEELKVLLKPLKDLAIIMSGQSYSTLSIVLPSLHKLMNKHLIHDESDSKFVRDCKTAMLDDLAKRYQKGSEVRNILVLASFFDPRFRDLGFVTAEERQHTCETVKNEVLSLLQNQETETPDLGQTAAHASNVKQEPNLPNLPNLNIKSESEVGGQVGTGPWRGWR